MNILNPIRGIGFVNFGVGDVVRHRLVKDIINAYDKESERKAQWKEEQKAIRDEERAKRKSRREE